MNEEKLMVQIGYKHDKHGNKIYDEVGRPIPIFKEVKKVIVQYIDDKRQFHTAKVKPFFNGQIWLFEAFHRMFSIDKNNIFFDTRLNFYVLTQGESLTCR